MDDELITLRADADHLGYDLIPAHPTRRQIAHFKWEMSGSTQITPRVPKRITDLLHAVSEVCAPKTWWEREHIQGLQARAAALQYLLIPQNISDEQLKDALIKSRYIYVTDRRVRNFRSALKSLVEGRESSPLLRPVIELISMMAAPFVLAFSTVFFIGAKLTVGERVSVDYYEIMLLLMFLSCFMFFIGILPAKRPATWWGRIRRYAKPVVRSGVCAVCLFVFAQGISTIMHETALIEHNEMIREIIDILRSMPEKVPTVEV